MYAAAADVTKNLAFSIACNVIQHGLHPTKLNRFALSHVKTVPVDRHITTASDIHLITARRAYTASSGHDLPTLR